MRYLLYWRFQWVSRAKSDDCFSEKPREVALRVQRNCKFIRKRGRQQPYRTKVEVFHLLQFIEFECMPEIARQSYRKVCIFLWQHRRYSKVDSRKNRRSCPHLCEIRCMPLLFQFIMKQQRYYFQYWKILWKQWSRS